MAISTEIIGDQLVITISEEYLANSSECALTTGGEKTVTDRRAMLRYFAERLEKINDDSEFNRCIDLIAEDALQQGENWIDLDNQ